MCNTTIRTLDIPCIEESPELKMTPISPSPAAGPDDHLPLTTAHNPLPRLNSSTSFSEMQRARRFNLLVAANGPKDVAYAQAIAVRLSKEPQIRTRVVVDEMTHRLTQEFIVMQNRSLRTACAGAGGAGGDGGEPPSFRDIDAVQRQAFELVEWADLLVLAPIDADNLAKMMCGIADTLLLEVLRGWDTSKRIILVPGMTTHMWESPMTRRQIRKLNRKWQWTRVMSPILWQYERMEDGSLATNAKRIVKWDAFNDVVANVKHQADLSSLGRDVDVVVQGRALAQTAGPTARSKLPPEIWTIILEYTHDWELAQSLGVFTSLEMPSGWHLRPRDPGDPLQVYMHELEWTLLSADTRAICRKLAVAPASLCDLSALAISLIFKFALRDVLTFIEANCPHVFKYFDGKTIPAKVSAYYGHTEILDWWARSPSFLEKHYDAEALDGASKNGYVHVLDWWRRSGLPLKYTDAALEQASAHGQLHVLEWWREASLQDAAIVPRPGRSLLAAAQWGRLDVIQWWEDSGLNPGHQEHVCKTASGRGQVAVLELWRNLRGDDKLQFEGGTVLAEATLKADTAVLDWWRRYAHGELPGMNGRPGRRVEYRTMDIEEALEDARGDQTEIRRWWAENGLNLGLGTSEWMRPRCL